MTLLIKPRVSTRAPFVERATTGAVLMLASPLAAARTVIFKVRDWDPNKHPRGYKGLFMDTPDKMQVKHVQPQDVIATKSGKVFRVIGHGTKGAKVESVDPDTGEVLTRRQTVIAHGIEVAKIEGGKGVGTRHEIGQLSEGTYIQHPKSGKRFVVSKHGNWTTVYPVDNKGARIGKHTVLPKDMEVIVSSREQGGPVTQATVNAIQRASAPSAPVTKENPLGVKTGDQVRGKNTGTVYDVVAVEATPSGGRIVVHDDQGNRTTIDPANYERHVEEILPQNLKRPPRQYASGVGEKSALVIQEVRTPKTGLSSYNYAQDPDVSYVLKRVPDGADPTNPGEVLGQYDKIGRARSSARSLGESHEAITERRVQGVRSPLDLEHGDWIVQRGKLFKVDRTEAPPPGRDYTVVYTMDGRRRYLDVNSILVGKADAIDRWVQSHKDEQLPGTYAGQGKLQTVGDLWKSSVLSNGWQSSEQWLNYWADEGEVSNDLMQLFNAANAQQKDVRGARPNLYLSQLQQDWKPEDLIGKNKGEALLTLRKLGYGEVMPREPNMTKYVNALGRRIHVHNKGGVVTAVDEIQVQSTRGGSGGFYGQLQAVLDSGGDLTPLDPSKSAFEEERTSHVRQILYDMAQGKRNGVERLFQTSGSTAKVKTDTQYRTEIEADPSFASRASFASQVTDPGLHVPVRADVMASHWPGEVVQGSMVDLPGEPVGSEAPTAAIALGERNGVAQAMKDQGITDYKEAVNELAQMWAVHKQGMTTFQDAYGQATGDYLEQTLNEIEPRGARQWDLRESELSRRLDSVYNEAIREETLKRRKAEGTIPAPPGGASTFELPLWDDIKLESQDIYGVESLAQSAPQPTLQTPFFATGGIVRDGVLYARRNRGNWQINAVVPMEFDQLAVQRVGGHITTNSKHPNPPGSHFNRTSAGTMLLVEEPGGKRIEYVPHGNGDQQAPTNQRGRLTLEGYTPAEAADKLKSLGIIHDLEAEVPYSSVFRADRKYGVVTPLHSDYVSGAAPLPRIPTAIIHGMSGYNTEPVFNSGGLLPIVERFRAGIPISGTIPLNDIRGGVDHVVFAAMSMTPSPYGDVSVIYKDSAYLRRDLIFTDRAFGSGATRYPAYRSYMNDFRRRAGDADSNTNIYTPLSPGARQSHIDHRLAGVHGHKESLGPSDNEWDVVGGVPIEDMAYIAADGGVANQINRQLDTLLRNGQISERPEVISARDVRRLAGR